MINFKIGPKVKMHRVGKTHFYDCTCLECGSKWTQPFTFHYLCEGTLEDPITGRIYNKEPERHNYGCSGRKK